MTMTEAALRRGPAMLARRVDEGQRLAAPPAPGTLGDLLALLEVTPEGWPDCVRRPVALRRLRAGATLVRDGAPLECLYFVREGSLKRERVREDGYLQVLGVAAPGDVIGFAAICTRRHTNAVVALEDCSVYAITLTELDDLRARLPALDRALQRIVSAQLARSADLVDVMSAVAAEVRLARFLLLYAARVSGHGHPPNRFRLSLSRRDIASLLGVAHETVSRSFGELIDWGCLRVSRRDVEILDLDGLADLARNTRGLIRERAPVAARHGPGATVHRIN